MKLKFALAVALTSVINMNVAQAASKEQIVYCDAIAQVAFDLMNARQNLVKKETFTKNASTTKEIFPIIERAYASDEVPVHEIAYVVRDFADAERYICMAKHAI